MLCHERSSWLSRVQIQHCLFWHSCMLYRCICNASTVSLVMLHPARDQHQVVQLSKVNLSCHTWLIWCCMIACATCQIAALLLLYGQDAGLYTCSLELMLHDCLHVNRQQSSKCTAMQFFGAYTHLLQSENYVTRRQSLKVSHPELIRSIPPCQPACSKQTAMLHAVIGWTSAFTDCQMMQGLSFCVGACID